MNFKEEWAYQPSARDGNNLVQHPMQDKMASTLCSESDYERFSVPDSQAGTDATPACILGRGGT